MGEYGDHFRLATTTGRTWWWSTQNVKNQLYVLNMQLEIVGSVNDIAPGETIYSARFMGERAYLVTFVKIDPFFVIDLSDPFNPVILGELKIPGYSDYLHPYDENHVIGLGKDTVASESEEFSWYQGVKLSLFDVTDVNNPKEKSKFIIGDRGTYSIAQHDPHAFLFSHSKNLLVIPIRLHEIDPSSYSGEIPGNAYGEFVWEGAYVLTVSEETGITLQGRISHTDEFVEENRWYRYNQNTIMRSFYIGDVLYTVSPNMIKATDLDTMDGINVIQLPRQLEV
jgi:uncharacterized secreted protein with C-terminal beta-propeller domain